MTLTGNWQDRKLDSNGDGDFTDASDRSESNTTFSPANEWTARRARSTPTQDDYAYTYDAVGNLTRESTTVVNGGTTSLGQKGYVYDAFGRLTAVTGIPVEGEPTYVAKYRYNGLGFRTMWQYDANANGTLEDSERYYFAYDERWRILATYRNANASIEGLTDNPKERYVYHAAGVGGMGGSSYIDSVVLRDRDSARAWTADATGDLDERRYYCQNWRGDVVAITNSYGVPLEYVRYSSYGEPTVYPVADANVDGSVNGSDPTYYFCYDDRWRVIATYRGSDASPKEQFIYHAAGLRGMGGSTYIDSVVLRDRDANSGWTSASDGTLEERIYYCQNWRGDVVCLTDSSGDPQEWVRYSAYGVPFCIPKGDYNCDGVLDSNDTSELTGMIAGSYGFWKDFNQDGVADSGDTSDLSAYITANSGAPGGRGKLSRGDGTTSSSALGNRIGYAGYQFDPALSGSVWHVRNRVLVSELGRWTRRDPIGYRDGTNLNEYVRSAPGIRFDSAGLRSQMCSVSRGVATCCTTDADDPDAKEWCRRHPYDYGVTPRDGPGPNSKPTGPCYICLPHIHNGWSRDLYPEGTQQEYDLGIDIIANCATIHENTHQNQCGGVPQCRECLAFSVELECLLNSKSRCGRSEVCLRMVENDIERVRTNLGHNCDVRCVGFKNPDPCQ